MGMCFFDGGIGFEPRMGRSISIDSAAEMLGCSRRTVYNRIREGRLRTIRTLGGSQRVTVESVHEQLTAAAAAAALAAESATAGESLS